MLSREALLAPNDSGEPAIVVGDASSSELLTRVRSTDPDFRMPPEEPLERHEVDVLSEWIDAGAPWPAHWAYQSLRSETTELGGHSARLSSASIDNHVRRKLRSRQLTPAESADRRTLIRRLSLDLTGLLPTIAETNSFARDLSPNAYKKLVDGLLASPHFGERWARHWLDEARYADSEGYEKDSPKQDAYRYRDWVIQAINDDVPFDEFTVKQIAGDLLPEPSAADLIATKFHLQAQFNLEGGVDAEEDRTKRVIDRINTTSTVWLATTLGCCQCHDHPYDPIGSRDFYAMYAFFNDADITADFLGDQPDDASELRTERQELWRRIEKIRRRQIDDKNLSNAVQNRFDQLRKLDNNKGFVRYLRERTEDRRTTYAFERGDFLRPKLDDGPVIADTPSVLPPLEARGDQPDRLDLAQWMVRTDNPLVARVAVNKVWMHLFGSPLVGSPGDFGTRGQLPSLPRLLDELASWFVNEANWSRKALIRLIVNTETYRQSSDVRPELFATDPENRLLARQNRFRLEAEILRDITLQAGGLLSRKIGGPSVYPPLPALVAQQVYATSSDARVNVSSGEDRYRRGLYTFFRRTAIDPNLSTFDCPDSSAPKPQRDRSNNAIQALALLQNEVFHEAAQGFAKRLLELSHARRISDEARLRYGFEIALSRLPAAEEVAVLLGVLRDARAYYSEHSDEAKKLIGNHGVANVVPAENAAWITTGRVILNLDEFVTRN